MSKIPTIDSFFDTFAHKYNFIDNTTGNTITEEIMFKDSFNQAVHRLIQLHVEAALKEAEKETVKHISKTTLELNMYNKNSILNAYPLTNIK